MPLNHVFIPYGAYWSTPFCRWQGGLSAMHSVELAARVASDFLRRKEIPPATFDGLALGYTIPQHHIFYGAPWLAGMIGAGAITGPMISQACATSARLLAGAALEVEAGQRECVLAVACDRASNGPHLYYPDPRGPGGRGQAEDWVWDNFNLDPYTGGTMLATAEAVAREAGFTRKEQDDVCLLRHGQYQETLADDRAFQRRYLIPVAVPKGKKETITVEVDEGPRDTTEKGLAQLRPVLEGGTVTAGTQTFPADGNAGVIVCTRDRARALARDPAPPVRLLAYGEARVAKGLMPKATVPAARDALRRAGVNANDLNAIKTHNPFAVNDLFFCREMGRRPEEVNRFGSSLVYGHPQGPTGMRGVIELIEELAAPGGGNGLFTGCAAGDTAMAVVVRVG
ncbi:MAG: thiolase family protein [Planctomycetes bacterium]|nr:thiolase family protein [Planctomycetota bacterium]